MSGYFRSWPDAVDLAFVALRQDAFDPGPMLLIVFAAPVLDTFDPGLRLLFVFVAPCQEWRSWPGAVDFDFAALRQDGFDHGPMLSFVSLHHVRTCLILV